MARTAPSTCASAAPPFKLPPVAIDSLWTIWRAIRVESYRTMPHVRILVMCTRS